MIDDETVEKINNELLPGYNLKSENGKLILKITTRDPEFFHYEPCWRKTLEILNKYNIL